MRTGAAYISLGCWDAKIAFHIYEFCILNRSLAPDALELLALSKFTKYLNICDRLGTMSNAN